MKGLALALLLLAANEPAARAEAHFAAGEYEQAIEALHEAYALEPRPAVHLRRGLGPPRAEPLRRGDRGVGAVPRHVTAQGPGAEGIQRDRGVPRQARARAPPRRRPPPSHRHPRQRPSHPPRHPPRREHSRRTNRGTGTSQRASCSGPAWRGSARVAPCSGSGPANARGARRATTEGAFRDEVRTGNRYQAAGIAVVVVGRRAPRRRDHPLRGRPAAPGESQEREKDEPQRRSRPGLAAARTALDPRVGSASTVGVRARGGGGRAPRGARRSAGVAAAARSAGGGVGTRLTGVGRRSRLARCPASPVTRCRRRPRTATAAR